MVMDLKKAELKLNKLYKTREYVLPLQRKAVMLCATAIREIHMGKVGDAKKRAKQVEKLIKRLEGDVKKYPRLTSFLNAPYQEYVELKVLISVLETGKTPKLKVPADAYILGSLDAVGELKRVCMELLAQGKKKEALALFDKMEKLYYSMHGYAFPNSLVPGLKHKQDTMKAVLDKLHHTIAEARMR